MTDTYAPLRMSYDDLSDVLYLSLGQPDRQAKSIEEPYGLIWRQSQHGGFQGVTVLDFLAHWACRRSELIETLAQRLQVPRTELEKRLVTIH